MTLEEFRSLRSGDVVSWPSANNENIDMVILKVNKKDNSLMVRGLAPITLKDGSKRYIARLYYHRRIQIISKGDDTPKVKLKLVK